MLIFGWEFMIMLYWWVFGGWRVFPPPHSSSPFLPPPFLLMTTLLHHTTKMSIYTFAPIPHPSDPPSVPSIRNQTAKSVHSITIHLLSFPDSHYFKKNNLGTYLGKYADGLLGINFSLGFNNGNFAPIPTHLPLAIHPIGKLNINQFESQFFFHHFKKKN